MSYVPEFVALYEIVPYIRNFPLNNYTIRNAVYFYLQGGEKRDAIIKRYGMSKVTDMCHMFYRADSFNQPIGRCDTSIASASASAIDEYDSDNE